MATFTITDDNNITVFATAAEAAQAMIQPQPVSIRKQRLPRYPPTGR